MVGLNFLLTMFFLRLPYLYLLKKLTVTWFRLSWADFFTRTPPRHIHLSLVDN